MNCKKKEHSLFLELNQEELNILNEKRFCISYSEGEYIYKQGMKPDYLICLNSGKAKITKLTSSGKTQIIGLDKPVDFLGIYDLTSDTPYTTSAIALQKTNVCLIPKAQLIKVIDHNPEFAKKIISLFAQKINEINSRLINHTQKNLRGRLADTLLYIHETFGFEKKSKFLDIQLKRSEIAELSNMDVSNASRTLSEFAAEGIIGLEGRKFEVFDISKLNFIRNQG
ncbi:MAG: Crp/Fnr family transcriptional regulator [Cyclobacteriaceae bacterium]|nr:Crp/Fnr family transcriptional regulator [Cyclobacteriaceae bacterium]